MSEIIVIKAQPDSALVDEKILITVTGLQPAQSVTLAAYVINDERTFISYAYYTATDDGMVDLFTQGSLGGTYEGLEEMGLFWSMVAQNNEPRRLLKKDVTTPIVTEIVVLDGHLPSLETTDVMKWRPLAIKTVLRWYKARGVLRQDVRDGRLIATFFLPEGDGPFPAVLDVFGGIGGIIEHRAALLASRGIASLSVCYFDFDNNNIITDLDYFEEAANWLVNHPKIYKERIGIVGVSKGGQMAMFAGAIFKKIKAVVSINAVPYEFLSMTYRGKYLPAHSFGLYEGEFEFDFSIKSLPMMTTVNLPSVFDYDATAPIEESSARFLIIESDDDHAMHNINGDLIALRLASRGRTNLIRKIYPGAGHLLEPPYSPHCRINFNSFTRTMMLWGGETAQHAKAQEEAWRLIQSFLWRELKPDLLNPYKHYYPGSRL